ncbi:MAG: TRAFs-binding domain-containing protein [Cyclobacteriaceae bacterium]|nr:TRAFs-binding domain-containing protein [Cyclobacteriaceae bacterium]MDH4295475.1 TRAFs-binding domain-containing protein [Cyclobacteriaceae bacterium]MDH5250537.1 TRAFs-binding domain-containing protein [Cyclobacteriaceae bacterium]
MSDISQLENLIQLGHYAEARTRAQDLLHNGADLRVKQLYALSLSKSGVPEAAQEYLETIIRDHPDDPETMGILGSIYKELFKKNQSSKYAILARDTYDKNFQLTKSYYTGINAASMSVLAGQSRRGKEIAQEVLSVLKDPENDFWEAATQAEAYLLLKERPKAVEAYLHARKLAVTDWGKINSVYNQLWLLKHYLPVPNEVIKAFSPPVVVAFVGHMIDHPNRSHKRFPPEIETNVKIALLNALRTLNAKIGYCSLACGGDILFAEAMEEVGGELNLFLPFKQSDFIDVSVRFAGEHWVERFTRLVNKYPVTYLTQEAYEGHADLFLLQTSIIFGLSVLRSLGNHEEPTLISVLSERDRKRKMGGTRDTVALWPFQKNHVTVNPDVFLNDAPEITPEQPLPLQPVSDRPVLYFVCCDFSSDNKLNTALLSEMETSSLPPVVLDMREDYMVAGFKTLFSAIEFCEVVSKTLTKPFQKTVTVRISMHVGPLRINAGETKQKLSGDAIEIVERLHKLALPGSIHATGIVAAILALEGKKYTFDYVDTLPVPGNAKALDVFKVHKHHVVAS